MAMNEKLARYLDGVFAKYEDGAAVRELKEELKLNLQERWSDLKAQGHDDEAAYRMSIDSLGDISEAIEGIAARPAELPRMLRESFSLSHLEGSDLQGVTVHKGRFNFSALKGTDFTGADLTESSFLCSDLTSVKFDRANLTRAKINMASLEGASFEHCILNQTQFKASDLSGLRFENLTLEGTSFEASSLTGTSFRHSVLRHVSFKHAEVKSAIFDDAAIDKLTYAILKGLGANLAKATSF